MVIKRKAEEYTVYTKMKLQIIHKGKYSWHSYRIEIGLKQDDVCKIWRKKKSSLLSV
jgi:hypothetical protein